jgi:transposase
MTYPARQDRDDVQKERKEFVEKVKSINISKLVSLDEASINLSYSRNYGHALKSSRIREGRKDARFQRKSILSTMRLNGKKCPVVFRGTLNKELFAEYLKSQLKPAFDPDDILLLDNSSVHKSRLVLQTLDELKIKYLFLPRYSPDFNPIELLWAYMKMYLRKAKARTDMKLDAAIAFVLDSLPNNHIENWYRHCGYTL